MNVTTDLLERRFPGEGEKRFRELARLGGFGAVGDGPEGHISKDFEGGLDLTGVLDPDNKALTDAVKNKIRETAGIGDDDKPVGASSADKMKGKESK